MQKKKKAIYLQPSEENETKSYILYQNGLVLLKKCIPLDIQQKLANDCIAYGKGDKPGIPSFYDGKTTRVMFNKDAGFAHIAYDEESNEKKINELNMGNKSRIVLDGDQLQSDWLELCDKYLKQAQELDPTLQYIVPKICSLNYYTNNAKIGWHTDKVFGLEMQEQSKLTSPVISFSIGNSCEFLYKNKPDEDAEIIILESGDVLVFGGPSRMILHTVQKIIKNTCPLELNMSPFIGRFNLTFREHNYKI